MPRTVGPVELWRLGWPVTPGCNHGGNVIWGMGTNRLLDGFQGRETVAHRYF